MNSLNNHHILILGWPLRPQQAWLSHYPTVTADRIYQEDLPRSQKRLKDLSFHMPRGLQFCDSVTPSHWYGDWKNHIDEYDTVILIDEVRGRDVFDYILSHNPHCRLCAFYDSPVRPGTPKEPSRYRDMPVHFYTCDRMIAKKYDAKFAPYFYIFSPVDFDEYAKMPELKCQRDVFFIGEEKGDRRERIEEITKILDQAGLTHELNLVPQNRHRSLLHRHKAANGPAYMPYSVVQERVRTSKAVLELISDGQTGITQRPFETLFLRKKLITTSSEVKSYDFYCPENIFILGERDIQELPDFLKTPFKPVAEEILQEYTLTGWLQNFLAP